MTAFLMFVVMAVATDTRAVGEAAALAVGGTIAMDALFGGTISGASMNPMRSAGPAIVSGNLHALWLYLARSRSPARRSGLCSTSSCAKSPRAGRLPKRAREQAFHPSGVAGAFAGVLGEQRRAELHDAAALVDQHRALAVDDREPAARPRSRPSSASSRLVRASRRSRRSPTSRRSCRCCSRRERPTWPQPAPRLVGIDDVDNALSSSVEPDDVDVRVV